MRKWTKEETEKYLREEALRPRLELPLPIPRRKPPPTSNSEPDSGGTVIILQM